MPSGARRRRMREYTRKDTRQYIDTVIKKLTIVISREKHASIMLSYHSYSEAVSLAPEAKRLHSASTFHASDRGEPVISASKAEVGFMSFSGASWLSNLIMRFIIWLRGRPGSYHATIMERKKEIRHLITLAKQRQTRSTNTPRRWRAQ